MNGSIVADAATPNFAPFRGWALAVAAQVDASCARGLVVDLYRAAVLKRQAAFVMLAALREVPPKEILDRLSPDSQDLLAAVRCHTARELIGAAWGIERVSSGFLRVLARIGDQPLDSPEDYRRLYDLLDPSKSHADVVQAIRYCNNPISSQRIHAVERLHPDLVFPAMLAACNGPRFAEAANQAYDVLVRVCSSLDGKEGKVLLRKLVESSGVAAFAKMLEQADRLPPPPIVSEDFKPLASASEMLRLALEFRNCVKTKVASVALGRAYYLRHDAASPKGITKVVIELESLSSGQWQVTTMEAPKGAILDSGVRVSVLRKLLEMGVLLSGPSETRYSHETLGLFGVYPLSWETTDWLDAPSEVVPDLAADMFT